MKLDRNRHSTTIRIALQLLFALSLLGLPALAQGKTRISVRVDRSIGHGPYEGSIYLLVSRNLVGEPRRSLKDGPFDGIILRRDLRHLRPDEEVVFDDTCAATPVGLAQLAPGQYALQAVLQISKTSADFTEAEGNAHSGTRRLELGSGQRHELVIDELIEHARPADVGRIRYRRIESRVVGRQIGHRFFMDTAVVMPLNYEREANRSYPVQYWIPGMGENTRSALNFFRERGLYFPPYGDSASHCENFILVLLDPEGREGFHGFVDSPAQGAFREALLTELIPTIEDEFPVRRDARGRFLVGEGAGGLAALRLMAEKPELFAGAWALGPHPLGMDDFFGLDLYADPPQNAFVDAQGQPRPLARHEGRVSLGIREQAGFEQVVRSGNLFQSYAAMFAPLGDDLRPRPLFDLVSGAIDPVVARAFCRHDFLANLEANWDRNRALLRGRLHVVVGDDDDFYLHRGVARLRSFLDGVGDPANVRILPDLDHAGLRSSTVQIRIQREIEAVEADERRP